MKLLFSADASYTLTDDFSSTPVALAVGETSSDIDLFDITLTDPTGGQTPRRIFWFKPHFL